ncbi:MAG: hypothetical protein IKW54_00205 [Bacteroidales bacterium]|nr:hypothetical protein [Bacteroidales bacterium]
MSDKKKIGELALQELGKQIAQGVSKNPQAALATGLAAAKTVGAAVVVAAPYIAAAAAGGAIVYGVGKIFTWW